ncbi:hypothetical protein PVAP13_8KG314002 [Panicum virgatum]|uniref:Secreted protein n=1 Tax=Panicum virgatum TaxID=38727 RepID=A0A8T0PLA8_PANVG|nr:hypothetical protein PVAP13_8KG314002 [Panicum virgatum]
MIFFSMYLLIFRISILNTATTAAFEGPTPCYLGQNHARGRQLRYHHSCSADAVASADLGFRPTCRHCHHHPSELPLHHA